MYVKKSSRRQAWSRDTYWATAETKHTAKITARRALFHKACLTLGVMPFNQSMYVWIAHARLKRWVLYTAAAAIKVSFDFVLIIKYSHSTVHLSTAETKHTPFEAHRKEAARRAFHKACLTLGGMPCNQRAFELLTHVAHVRLKIWVLYTAAAAILGSFDFFRAQELSLHSVHLSRGSRPVVAGERHHVR